MEVGRPHVVAGAVIAVVALVTGFAFGRATSPSAGRSLAVGEVRPTVVETDSSEAASANVAESGGPSMQLGSKATDGGSSWIVDSVTKVESVPRDEYANSGDGSPLRAQHGGQLVEVEFRYFNDGMESVDLYCSYGLGAALVDATGRRFDPVDDMYGIEGNTGCNELIQPGFGSSETIVFEIPTDATPVSLLLWDPSESDGHGGTDYDGTGSSASYSLT